MRTMRNQLCELWHRRIDGKISEMQMRREMLALLESNTSNTVAENQRVIEEFVKNANATRDFNNSLNALSGRP